MVLLNILHIKVLKSVKKIQIPKNQHITDKNQQIFYTGDILFWLDFIL